MFMMWTLRNLAEVFQRLSPAIFWPTVALS